MTEAVVAKITNVIRESFSRIALIQRADACSVRFFYWPLPSSEFRRAPDAAEHADADDPDYVSEPPAVSADKHGIIISDPSNRLIEWDAIDRLMKVHRV